MSFSVKNKKHDPEKSEVILDREIRYGCVLVTRLRTCVTSDLWSRVPEMSR